VFGPATALIEDIRREAAQWAQPISMKQVRLLSSILGTDIGILGAARIALDQHE
jgi:glucokinase